MGRSKPPEVIQILHRGSLMTVADADAQTENKERCLGFLMHFEGKGVFEPYFGLIEVTPEEADIHNKLLSDGLIKGLDENCEVGMCGDFYLDAKSREIHTFIGTVVGTVEISGSSVTMHRKGRVFRGRIRKHEDCITLKRVS